MAWTKQALYFKYVRGKNPPPAMVFFIRVDYDAHDGTPVGGEVVTSVDCKKATRTQMPDLSALEINYPGPTGLCSWHVIGVPRAKLADRPGIIYETQPRRSEQLVPEQQPTTIPTAAALASSLEGTENTTDGAEPKWDHSALENFDFSTHRMKGDEDDE